MKTSSKRWGFLFYFYIYWYGNRTKKNIEKFVGGKISKN